MNDNYTMLDKKYKTYISSLEDTNYELKQVLLIQEEQIKVLSELTTLQKERIAELTEMLEQALKSGKALAKLVDGQADIENVTEDTKQNRSE